MTGYHTSGNEDKLFFRGEELQAIIILNYVISQIQNRSRNRTTSATGTKVIQENRLSHMLKGFEKNKPFNVCSDVTLFYYDFYRVIE